MWRHERDGGIGPVTRTGCADRTDIPGTRHATSIGMWKPTLVSMILMTACHGGMEDSGAMREFIIETRSETQQHLAFARASASVQDLRVDVYRYRDAMMPLMADMDAMMDGMGAHCGGMGNMRDMHTALAIEMDQHIATMRATTQMSPARAEVERHAAATMSEMARMDGMMGTMSCW